MTIVLVQLAILATIALVGWRYLSSVRKPKAAGSCPSCGTTVSSNAVSCPKCGHRFGPNLQRMIVLGILLLLLALGVAMIVKDVQVNNAIDRLGR